MENSNSIPLQEQALNAPEKSMPIKINSKISEHWPKKYAAVWYNPNGHSSESVSYMSALKDIVDIQLFTKWEEVSKYLKANTTRCCQVVISEPNEEKIVKEIAKMELAPLIYVFKGQNGSFKAWTRQYHKVICVESDLKGLIEKIWQYILLREASKNEVIIMGEINETIKHFVKDSGIVWYYPNGDSSKNIDFLKNLKHLYDVQIFAERKEVLKYLENTPELGFQVISPETEAEQLVKEINHLKNVSCVYVSYAGNDISKHKAWSKQYCLKVVGVTNSFPELLNKIKQEISRADLPSFAPSFDAIDLSNMNHLHFYLRGFVNFQNRQQAKEAFLALATAFYKSKKPKDYNDIEDFKENYKEYDMKTIINWYTKESFLYNLVNNCLRVATPDSIQYSRLVLKDLETAIKEKYQLESTNFNGMLYRGGYMGDKEWTLLQKNVGQEIEMHGFLSTSTNKDTAISYSQEDFDKKVLITIIVPSVPGKGGQGFAEVKEYSDYQTEEEVLFNVRSRFTVLETKIEIFDNVERRHLVLLYGAQEMRKYHKLQNPCIEIPISNLQASECKMCKHTIDIKEESIVAINIGNHNEYVCQNCLRNSQTKHDQPLVCIIPSVQGLLSSSKAIKIEGTVVKYQGNLDIPFYGYQCSVCKKTRPNNCYTCLDCNDKKIIYCNECFFNQQSNKCNKKGHIVIYEGQPYTFWSDKMSDNELSRLQYLENELSRGDMNFQQSLIYFHTQNYEKFFKYHQELLETNCETNQELIAASHHNFGSAYEKLGEYKKALEHYSIAVRAWKIALGDKNQPTAASLHNLGSAYQGLGNYQEALKYYEVALEIQKEVLGIDHVDTATSYHSLGSVYHTLGDNEKAEEHYLKALNIREHILGHKHPETAPSYNNLGELYLSQEKLQKAEKYILQSLEIDKVILGDKDTRTAISYNNLGSVYKKQGDYRKAVEIFLKGLEITKNAFGNKHSQVATFYGNLGSVYEKLGNLERALESFMEAVKIEEAVCGCKHEKTAMAYNNLGELYKSLGKYEEAKKYYSKALEIHNTVFGENHTRTATSYANLGTAYERLGDYLNAGKNYCIAQEIRLKVVGNKHPDTASSYNNLGSLQETFGRYNEALQYYLDALNIMKEEFGDKHINTAAYYNNIGSCYKNKKDYQEALKYYKISMEITEKKYGNNHVQTAECYNNVGSAFNYLKQYPKAIENYSKSLEIKKAKLGDQHSLTAISYNNLGSVYYSLGDSQKALEHFLKALEIQKKVFGEMHLETATSYNNIGSIYYGTRQFKKAMESFVKAFEILTNKFGLNHPKTVACSRNLAAAKEAFEKHSKAA